MYKKEGNLLSILGAIRLMVGLISTIPSLDRNLKKERIVDIFLQILLAE
ncbi:hypothetical protein ES705_31661 [subsurface metagenome]